MDQRCLIEYIITWLERSHSIAFGIGPKRDGKWWRKQLNVEERQLLVSILRDALGKVS